MLGNIPNSLPGDVVNASQCVHVHVHCTYDVHMYTMNSDDNFTCIAMSESGCEVVF